MNINELADLVGEWQGLAKDSAKAVVESVLSAIVDAAAKGEGVALPGFGKFKVASRAARDGRNPATGAQIKIAASNKLTFTAAKAVKDALNPPPQQAPVKTTAKKK
jgi:DNA-binding protein HU-beta